MGANRSRTLALVTLLFAVLALIPWVLPSGNPAPLGLVTGDAAGGRTMNDLPPFESLAEAVRRPLFVAARRAAPTNASGQITPDGATIGRYRLTGVVITGDQRFVMLREGNSSRVIRVPEGGDIEGWTVKSIAQDRVLLGSARGEHSVSLGTARPAPSR